MKPQTKALLAKFYLITGVAPKSAKLHVGSMRGLIQFKMDY